MKEGFDKRLTMFTHIFFDFDGTIADTLPLSAHLYNEIAPQFGGRLIREEDVEVLRTKNLHELIRLSKIPLIQIPKVVYFMQQKTSASMNTVLPFAGIEEVLKELKKKGKIVGIVTTNSEANVRTFLRTRNLEKYIDFVHAEKALFGKGNMLRHVLKENNASSSQAVYIGDEVRDGEAANKAHISFIAVTWGLNAREAFTKIEPLKIVDSPKRLLQLLTPNP
ncbi:carotenoid oxygenase [Candidatus Cerribacteria bacterium 'Amazon FNV 2010 28 9']|uniref:Carotenoid oxygenase n=1 Tax=Candidatus Cerribacteria bacterium 'Amazon FNV 2010 28 9' TaxID=2081795 RepID=A0A317JQ32_9BACT|nr:MAG: carotenoid oxygenase [Candidatus Cerribacteria bacterium 'Amazon FNV 2010 28 9']